MIERLRGYVPLLVVMIVIILLGYPLALLFGLPLALRDMRDLRKWEQATIVAQPPLELSRDGHLTFPESPVGPLENPLLVRDGAPVDWQYEISDDGVQLVSADGRDAVVWAGPAEQLESNVYRLPEGVDAADSALAIYIDDRLVRGGTVSAREVADGQRLDFTLPAASGPLLVDDRLLVEGQDYTLTTTGVRFAEAPSFRANVRQVRGEYGVLAADEGLIVFTEPPSGEVRVAASVVMLAEELIPLEDDDGRRYRFPQEPVVQTADDRLVFVADRPLSAKQERPQERVDGQRSEFTFDSPTGIVTIEGVRQVEGEDYERNGNSVSFTVPPQRNAALRQYPDYFLVDARKGEIELGQAPDAGETVWTSRYTVHSRPTCGETMMECFLALPQHPVPFPNWIAEGVVPFFTQHPFTDHRNVLRATIYTTLGTMAALLLGSIVGIVLAVLFVLLRPLERALLPWVIASQTIPIIALVPVLLLILGNFGITIQTSLLPTAIIGAYIAFFPMVVGTVKGLRSVDPLSLDLMRSYAATPLQVFTKVRFPAAVPFFFTSLKLATAAALVGALVAEVESNNSRGLGYQILGQVQSGDVADVWILLIISALMGVGLVALVGLLQRLIAPWERTG